MRKEPLPALPAITVAIQRERTAEAQATGGFLNLRRLDLVARYPDGTESATFAYDIATRAALDAVIIAAHFGRNGRRFVFLRSALRPPCALRDRPPEHDGLLWELPAGLIEGTESPAHCAARELEEEVGIFAQPSEMKELGAWTFPVPGMCGERQIFFHLEVDPATRVVPKEDGSALERNARVVAVEIDRALGACKTGEIRDAKTELALRRLVEVL